MDTAEELITESITHTTIAHAAFTPDLAVSLMALSDDSAETAGVLEYWGTDDDGNAWRVHLERKDEFVWLFDGHEITVRIKPGPIPAA
jgi:hypothetical protein